MSRHLRPVHNVLCVDADSMSIRLNKIKVDWHVVRLKQLNSWQVRHRCKPNHWFITETLEHDWNARLRAFGSCV